MQDAKKNDRFSCNSVIIGITDLALIECFVDDYSGLETETDLDLASMKSLTLPDLTPVGKV